MSEWGIEQPSTFGNAGGCFVEGLSFVGGIAIVVTLLCTLPSGKLNDKQPQSQIESVKPDTIVNSPDTIAFKNIARQR